jgi:hypothetical protein
MYLDINNNNTIDEGEAVTLNQEITKADIVAGKLKFSPITGSFGTPYTSFKFKWYNGTAYSAYEYTQSFYVIKYVAGDVNKNGVIDNNEIAGDINNNGVINAPTEVAGDVNGNGVIDYPSEIAGDLNGNGVINRPTEVAGDVTGDGLITPPELAGDVNGDLAIVAPELLGDLNGNGILDDNTTGINGTDSNAPAIYPTITSDFINIRGNNNSVVMIYNTVGSLLLKSNDVKINIGLFGKGTYIVKTAGKIIRVIVQ